MDEKLILGTKNRVLAERFRDGNCPGKAFIHYLLTLKFMPQWKNDLRNSFSTVLCSFGKILESEERYDELFSSYEQALKVYPEDEVILNNLGAHLCRLHHPNEALIYFKKALQLNQYYLPAFRNLEITKSHLVERWHFRMLNDSLRNESFEKSIYKKIRSGFKNVLDIGTGTGLLSIYAKKSGAANVYSCDYSPTMISIAEKVIRANFLTDSIVIINKLSNDLNIPDDIPQRISLAVTETFDGGLLGEHVLQTLIHAWENLLEPEISEDGQSVERVVPHGGVLYVTPIESEHIARKHYLLHPTRIERNSYKQGLDLSVLNLFTISTEPYDTENLKNLHFSTLGPTKKLFEFNFNNLSELKQFYSGEKDKDFKIESNKEGFFDALAIWFELKLDSDIFITSCPFTQIRCCWEQAIFPMKNNCYINKESSFIARASCLNGVLSLDVRDSEMESNGEKNGVSQSIIRFLNSETLLLTYIEVLNYIKTVFRAKENISVLDLSWFPYTALLINKYFDSVVHVSSQHMEMFSPIKSLFASNEIKSDQFHFKKWPEMLELLELKNEKFSVIVIDILTTGGEINEEVISLIPLLRNLLDINGLFLPSRLTICCQLIFSEELANLSQMNSEGDELNISKFINEYKVSNMIDFKLEELKYDKMSSCFEIADLNMSNIVNENLKFEKEIDMSKNGTVNAVLYWFSINYAADIYFSTVASDSHINQAAALLDNVMNVENDSKLKMCLYYNSGAMKFVVS